MKKYKRILFISDLHEPYSHPDSYAFLKAIKSKYDPDLVVWAGDETDQHAFSFHPIDPDLYSAGHELDRAVEALKPYYKLFPKSELLESNHGRRAGKKAKFFGIPKRALKAYRDAIEAPEGWTWHRELVVECSDGSKVAFRHEWKGGALKAAQKIGMSTAQGHCHTKFLIEYVYTPTKKLFGLVTGCSIDVKSPAFEYDNENLSRPIIGHSIIIGGVPQLLPMELKNGRWTGKVP